MSSSERFLLERSSSLNNSNNINNSNINNQNYINTTPPPLPMRQQSQQPAQAQTQQSQKVHTSKSTLGRTVSAAWFSVTEVVNRHFASSTAVRDFNETMPIVLPRYVY